MKRYLYISFSIVFLFVCFWGIRFTSAKTLYDDFSSPYLDLSRWNQGEFVREVSEGKLVMILHNSQTEISTRKRVPFVDPSSIKTIEFEIMLSTATLDSGTNPESFARVDGRFYNAQNSGTQRGDIWAGLYIGDRGSGLEAWWYVSEAIDDNGNTWDDKGSGSLNVPGLSYNQSYTVKIDYDGVNKFTFTVAGMSSTFTGPVRQGVEYTKYKALETVVYAEGGNGDGYVSASFDNVLTNGSAYDDFSASPLDQTKWERQESAREIENGRVRLVSHSTGDKDTTNLYFSEVSPYTEAIATIKSSSIIEAGDRGIARIDGFLYNDTYGPGNYNDYEGDVWVAIYINYHGDGILNAACYAERTLDAASTQFEELFYRQFNLPIILDRDYKLSIQFTDSNLRFIIKDTVTGRMDVFGYAISKSAYEPYEKAIGLLSRVYGNSTGGYMAVEFDDIYTDVAEPAATFDATGNWEITGSNPWSFSGCDLPEVGDTSPMTITQNGNDLTMVVHDDEGDFTLTGYVYGDTYTFMTTEENNGETEITYGIFTLSQNTSGAGNVTFIKTDGVERCESGFDIAFTNADTDGDGTPDISDTDDDDDGVLDADDAFPLDDSESKDTDKDGTGNNADTDDDNDGVSDEEEAAGPNGGDSDKDGIQDSLQSNVSNLNVGDAEDYIVFESPDDTNITECQVSDTPADAPVSAVFDYGFFEFTLGGLAAGGTTTVTLTFPDSSPDFDTYYKFGPTADNATPHWYEFKYDAATETGAKIDNTNHTITLYFKDGARGDDDLTANGSIVDIGGPARAVTVDAGGDGGGDDGCFISAVNK